MASLSEMPMDVLHNFAKCYVRFCALKNMHTLLAVKKYLPKKIDFVCDTLTVKDWSILLRCLKYDKSLTCICIRSRKTTTTEVLTKVDTKEKAAAIEKQRHPLLYTKYIKVYLMQSLKMCLTNHPELKCLKLEGLPLEDEDIKTILDGLNACTSLLHVSFNKSHIGDAAITQICHILKHKSNILSVDFGDCNVGVQGVDAIARMIVYQNLCRHDEGWRQSLRDRAPALDQLPGLRRITLNQNKMLGDRGVEMLINALVDDRYIKALDLQECGITSSIAEKLIALLEENKAIKIIDVRCNAQLNDEHLQSIMETLSKNNDGEIHEFTWLELPYSMRPARVYPPIQDMAISTTSVRTIRTRRELPMATTSSCNRKPTVQRTYSFAGAPKNMLASPSTKICRPLPEKQFEQRSTCYAAPPPSPMKSETLTNVHQHGTKVAGSDGDNVMTYQKDDVSSTDSSPEGDPEADAWRLQSNEGSHEAVFNNMRKAQSYHCKSQSNLPDKSLMRNACKSESVVNEPPPSLGALEKNVGDGAKPRHHLDMRSADGAKPRHHLDMRSHSNTSDFAPRRQPGKDVHKGQPLQRTTRTNLLAKEVTGSSNRILPQTKSSKTKTTAAERNKNDISNYVPK